MAREYGRKPSRSRSGLGAGARYLALAGAILISFALPRVVHDELLVGVAECGLWIVFIAWVLLGLSKPKDS